MGEGRYGRQVDPSLSPFLAACRGEAGAVYAGLVHAPGRALAARVPAQRRGPGSILDAVRDPALAAELTLQPRAPLRGGRRRPVLGHRRPGGGLRRGRGPGHRARGGEALPRTKATWTASGYAGPLRRGGCAVARPANCGCL